MKHLLFIAIGLTLCLLGPKAQATEQFPDYIVIDGERFELYVDWSFPSPLQTYYHRTGQQSPFHSWSTANYRGHIARWEVRDGQLYLTEVDTRSHYSRTGTYFPNTHKRFDTVAHPSYFGIESLGGSTDGSVVADWFTGPIVALRPFVYDEKIYYDNSSSKRQVRRAKKVINERIKQNERAGDIYLYVQNGKVVAMQTINLNDKKRASKISFKDTSDHEFMAKYELLYTEQQYKMYHLAAGSVYDSVTIDGHGARFDSGDDFAPSLIMPHFDNNPDNWPFSWSNFQLCGAPLPRFELIHDSLFVTGIEVATMSKEVMFNVDCLEVPLDSVFPPEALANGRVFASWISGQHTVQFTVADNYNKFLGQTYVDKIIRLELKEGVATHKQYYPTTFEQDSANGTDRAKHFCNPDIVCCTRFGLWLPVDIKQLPQVTEGADYMGDKQAMRDFLAQHPLADTTINGRFFIGFGLNSKGVADHFWMTDLRNPSVIDWGEDILNAIRQLPQQWQPAKYADTEGGEAQPVDSYQVIDVTIANGRFTQAHLRR